MEVLGYGIARVVMFSIIIWYIVDKLKERVWNDSQYKGYITMGAAAALAVMVVVSFQLDMIYELKLHDAITVAGQILTVLAYMGGASVVAEIMERVQDGQSGVGYGSMDV